MTQNKIWTFGKMIQKKSLIIKIAQKNKTMIKKRNHKTMTIIENMLRKKVQSNWILIWIVIYW